VQVRLPVSPSTGVATERWKLPWNTNSGSMSRLPEPRPVQPSWTTQSTTKKLPRTASPIWSCSPPRAWFSRKTHAVAVRTKIGTLAVPSAQTAPPSAAAEFARKVHITKFWYATFVESLAMATAPPLPADVLERNAVLEHSRAPRSSSAPPATLVPVALFPRSTQAESTSSVWGDSVSIPPVPPPAPWAIVMPSTDTTCACAVNVRKGAACSRSKSVSSAPRKLLMARGFPTTMPPFPGPV
jgi:hypothetical protein